MEKKFFNKSTLTMWKAVMAIIKEEQLEAGEYKFDLLHAPDEDGKCLHDILLRIDEDKTFVYGGLPLDGYVVAQKVIYDEDGRVNFDEEVVTKEVFEQMKQLQSDRFEVGEFKF